MAGNGSLDRPLRFAYFDAREAGVRGGTPGAKDMAAHINLSFDGWAIAVDPRDLFRWGDVVRDDVRVLARVFMDRPFCDHNLPYQWIPVLARIPRDAKRGGVPVQDWYVEDGYDLPGVGNLYFSRWLFLAIGIRPTDLFFDLTGIDTGMAREFELWREIRQSTADAGAGVRQMLLPFAEESA